MLKIVLCAAVWLLATGMSYLVGDIAFGSDISEYIETSNLALIYAAGGLVIALAYGCWYLLRRENKLTDILIPVCVLLAWGLARRKLLYAGGKGMLYSIAYALKRVYGVRTGFIDLEYVSTGAVAELVLFVTAIVMFFAGYMIYRYNSLMIAVAMTFLFMAVGAVLDVDVKPQGIVLAALSVIVCRYVLVRIGQPVSFMWNVAVPIVLMAVCMMLSLFTYEKAYEKGLENQPKLAEFADRIEFFITGDNGRGYSNYYRIDDTAVEPSDDVVDEIVREDKPVGNLYVTSRTYVTYESGIWRARDIGYSHDNSVFLAYDEAAFEQLAQEMDTLAAGRRAFSKELMADVQGYIRDRIHYTTTPKSFDDGVEPVMYALYEGHEGYCIHYATAAAIAFRTLGIPSRYDIGYVIPSSAWELQADGTYRALVLDKYSHAWSEVYDDENEMWTIVDATPMEERADALNIPREPENSSEAASDGGSDETPAEEMSTEETSTEEMSTEEMSTEEMSSEEASTEEVSTDEPSVDEESTGEVSTENSQSGEEKGTDSSSGNAPGKSAQGTEGDGTSSGGFALYLAAVSAAVVLLVLIAEMRRRIIVTGRRRRLSGRHRINAMYELSAAMYEMLSFAGIAKGVSEDDREYARIVTEKCPVIKDDEFMNFIECVQAGVYGRIEPDDEQVKAAARLYGKIRAYAYLSLSFKDKLVWRYVRCYDTMSKSR